ncbi:MAG: hypothetical protein GY841_19475, partial [FCB group bacterium]|nr:hypothetical protein [FCB group bacterium]
MKSKQPIIHPWLLAIFPALFLYSHNTGIVALSDIIRPMLLLLVGTSLLFILLSLVFKNRCKTGLVLSLFLTLFFAYGHIHSLMPDLRLHIGPYVLYPNTVLFPIWSMVLLIGAFIIIRSRSNLIKVSTGVNIIASLLIFVSVVTAAGGLIGGGSDDGGGLDRATSTVVAGQRPDIYYIILDGYTGNDVLR